MVFNEEFDRTIWIILASDKDNRFNIAEFIYNMPRELLEKIYNQLKLYSSDNDNKAMKSNDFRKALRDKDGNNYFYTVDMDSQEIKINLKKWNSSSDKLEENIGLSLYAISIEDLTNIEEDFPLYIGNYHYNTSGFLNPFSSTLVVLGDERDYEIFENTILGLKISVTDDNRTFRRVNIKNMPQDISLSDLGDRCSVNRLVRGRKK